MDFWNEQADRLENALLANASALVLHYLRTVPPDAVATLVGEALPDNRNARDSVVATLIARLAQA